MKKKKKVVSNTNRISLVGDYANNKQLHIKLRSMAPKKINRVSLKLNQNFSQMKEDPEEFEDLNEEEIYDKPTMPKERKVEVPEWKEKTITTKNLKTPEGPPVPNSRNAIPIWKKTGNINLPKDTDIYLNFPLFRIRHFLKYLHISDTSLTTIPLEIKYLTNLNTLILNSNKLKFIPSEIGKLKLLEHLNLINNQIEYLPHEISSLKQLKVLRINGNPLRLLPYKIWELENLRELKVDYNLIDYYYKRVPEIEPFVLRKKIEKKKKKLKPFRVIEAPPTIRCGELKQIELSECLLKIKTVFGLLTFLKKLPVDLFFNFEDSFQHSLHLMPSPIASFTKYSVNVIAPPHSGKFLKRSDSLKSTLFGEILLAATERKILKKKKIIKKRRPKKPSNPEVFKKETNTSVVKKKPKTILKVVKNISKTPRSNNKILSNSTEIKMVAVSPRVRSTKNNSKSPRDKNKYDL